MDGCREDGGVFFIQGDWTGEIRVGFNDKYFLDDFFKFENPALKFGF